MSESSDVGPPTAIEQPPAGVDWQGALARIAGWGASILNGFVGDRLAERERPLAISMRLVGRKGEVALERRLRSQLGPVTGSICILVHGLACNEQAWSWFHPENRDYGSLLQQDLGYTPLYLRYNSGRHVSDNGCELAQLITALCAAWPVPIEQIVLIGHSLGGLVVRSACHYGRLDGASWCHAVRRVFLLGTPNLGAPLEKLAELVSQTLKRIRNPYTYLVGGLLELRSSGIKDLRFGYLVDEEWRRTPERPLRNNRLPIPLLPGASHYVLAGTLTEDVGHLVTRWFGDCLVRLPSATGQEGSAERSIPFPRENCRVFPRLNHFDLIWHPEVYRQIRHWCGE
ncbi:MAG: alpha/beta fold hydrolase [Myxococcales bacterium]|nr:alpha/beta fold hydrolase [Myxococcales bacterium]